MAVPFNIRNLQTVFVTIIIGAGTIFGMYLYQKKRKNAVPTVWQPIGKVKGLYLYPLKSGRRVELKKANCTEYGIESDDKLRDRCLVVYKEGSMEYKTARTYPKIVLIEVRAKNANHFTIDAPGMETLEIDISSLNKVDKSTEITYGDEQVFTIDCGDKAAQWISKYILQSSFGLRLGFHNGLALHRRSIETVFQPLTKIYPYLDSASMGLYSDLSSYMLMNQSSVDELTARIHEPSITVHNFRPNILVEGDNISPFAEDKWDWIKIGEVILHHVKPCTRCILTTIDHETGIKSLNSEPLKTLKTYRKVKDIIHVDIEGEDPIMGNYMRLKHVGQISVGDTVFLGSN